jgi:hypothetical protein
MEGRKDEIYDLLILTDATASMGAYLRALRDSLPEIIRISSLTGCFARIGVLAYRDYCGGELTEWSGWYASSSGEGGDDCISQDQLLRMAKKLVPDYGGDWPEATKTGLARAHLVMREEATTVILLYTDAPPHMPATRGENRIKEIAMLSQDSCWKGSGPLFVDWVKGARVLQSGKKKGKVFTLVQSHLIDTLTPYMYLCHMTGGSCFELETDQAKPENISKITMALLLAWMGVGKSNPNPTTPEQGIAKFRKYKSVDTIDRIENEDDQHMEMYFLKRDEKSYEARLGTNLESVAVTLSGIKDHVERRSSPIQDFSKRYKADSAYRGLVVNHLGEIINADVTAVTINPIFGTLWRTVCNDRANEARDRLIQEFGLQVDRITNLDQRTRMKTWLAESYDYAEEIRGIISEVAEADKFPCVFLNPTESFNKAATEKTAPGDEDDDSGDDGNRPITDFKREELLEIGRSCDYRILRRLGKVLTRLTFVQRKEDLPAYVGGMSIEDLPQIPLALATSAYERKFWKILLHVVIPGTLITPRPAALLAALSNRMGILPLRHAADEELLAFSGKWNTLDIPETWNTSCLSLLLDADKDYEGRVKAGITLRSKPENVVIQDRDRKLFQVLVDYKLLELNLNTTLQAKIGWSPNKAKTSIGPVVVCKVCKFPRSVTVMGPGGVCGLCQGQCKCEACLPSDEERRKNNVTVNDNEKTDATWVECVSINCRAQYIVYNPEALRVRAKCFYCRHQSGEVAKLGPAPRIECASCLSQIIWPEEYRPADLEVANYKCPACMASRTTIVDHETTPRELIPENGTMWLIRNDETAIRDPFNGRSLFHTISHVEEPPLLAQRLEILPAGEAKLSIRGKAVRNQEEIVKSLRGWVDSRRTESGVCSLCFSNFRKNELHRACGRSGCLQRVCKGCMEDWYGLNSRGRIINVAALSCAFCRRKPAPKTIAAFGITQLGDLRTAVEDAGSWIYAWCATCGFARRYLERVCAAGAPPDISNWSCDDCGTKKRERHPIKNCPGCGTPTQKMGGCDHITCEVPGCDAHWCFFCGENVGEDKIYEHMDRDHGGLYIEEEGDNYDDEDDYEDY